VKVFSAVTALG